MDELEKNMNGELEKTRMCHKFLDTVEKYEEKARKNMMAQKA
jgi:hypothetical protein